MPNYGIIKVPEIAAILQKGGANMSEIAEQIEKLVRAVEALNELMRLLIDSIIR